MPLATIQISRIAEGRRLRSISEAQVAALVASIGDVGLLNPITVYERPVIEAGVSVDGYGLVAGAHRVEACRRLGLVDIDANVVALSELERQIAECDENLCGTNLSKSERALFTKRRKDAYEALHPETKKGVAGAEAKHGRATDNLSFAEDTAQKTGVDARTIQRDAERGEKVVPEALDMIRGTALDTGRYLDSLKAIAPEEQVSKVKKDLATDREKRKPVSPPAAPRNDFEIINQQHKALLSAWEKARPEARERFLADINASIDVPVFDRSAA